MDLETFLITLYVLIDDWYDEVITPNKPKKGGSPPRMSDSEVLTLAIAGQWRVGVPWQSERGLVRHIHANYLSLFPKMLKQSGFNARVRRLWGAFILLQQHVASLLESADDMFECVDCDPLPAHSYNQSLRENSHWLWESTSGYGGNHAGMFIGDHLLLSVTRSGAITGWLTATAAIQDRWLMQVFLSGRAGKPQLVAPAKKPRAGNRLHPPSGHIGPIQAVGQPAPRPYLTDHGFNGEHWLAHWDHHYGAEVISAPHPSAHHAWSKDWLRWLSSLKQPIETAFAFLDEVFGMKRLNAHSRWGQYTRIAAKTAAYNIGRYINRLLERPEGALGTLVT